MWRRSAFVADAANGGISVANAHASALNPLANAFADRKAKAPLKKGTSEADLASGPRRVAQSAKEPTATMQNATA